MYASPPDHAQTSARSARLAPQCIVLAGPPCSGKSTLARILAEKHHLRWIQMDEVLSQLIPHSDRNESDRLIGYRGMLILARELGKCSRSVVLDATFTSSSCRTLLRNWIDTVAIPTRIIQVRVPAALAVKRFRERRGHSATDLDEPRIKRLAENYPYVSDRLIVDGSRPLGEALSAIEEYVGLNPSALDGRTTGQ
jgi:predicted kinase